MNRKVVLRTAQANWLMMSAALSVSCFSHGDESGGIIACACAIAAFFHIVAFWND